MTGRHFISTEVKALSRVTKAVMSNVSYFCFSFFSGFIIEHVDIMLLFLLWLTDGCVYKGVDHRQGDTWDDGCDYRCQCSDANSGLYTCTRK